MAKITYANKSAMIVDPIIEDAFKIKAEDVNEIKAVVNTNADVQVSSSDASVRNIRYLTRNQFDTMKANKTFEQNVWYQVDGNEIIASTSSPCGVVVMWPGYNAQLPNEWMWCDGRSLKKSDYEDLFAVIGYLYGGSGDNFNIPDYRGRFFVGYDGTAEFANITDKGGHKLLQAHTHSANVTDLYYYGWKANDIENTVPPNAPASGGRPWTKLSIGSAGGGDAQNLPPYVVGHYAIKVKKDLYTEDLKNLDECIQTLEDKVEKLSVTGDPYIVVTIGNSADQAFPFPSTYMTVDLTGFVYTSPVLEPGIYSVSIAGGNFNSLGAATRTEGGLNAFVRQSAAGTLQNNFSAQALNVLEIFPGRSAWVVPGEATFLIKVIKAGTIECGYSFGNGNLTGAITLGRRAAQVVICRIA